MYDFHVHTDFSEDSSAKMEDIIQGAIKAGLKEMCFTDHMDYDFNGLGLDSKSFLFNIEEYFTEIEQYKKKYEDDISIKIGIELGLQPHILDICSKDIKSHPFDFAIASVHSVERKDMFYKDYFENKTQKQAYEVYFQNLLYMVNNYNDYNILGHIDIIKRYGGYSSILPLKEYYDLIVAVLKKVIEEGKGIEINTSGIRYKLGDCHPSRDIVTLYYELGGEIITLASDAHRPEDVAFDFNNVLNYLKDMGFKYINSFDKMLPVFHKIDDLIL